MQGVAIGPVRLLQQVTAAAGLLLLATPGA